MARGPRGRLFVDRGCRGHARLGCFSRDAGIVVRRTRIQSTPKARSQPSADRRRSRRPQCAGASAIAGLEQCANLGEITHPGQLRIAANCNRLVRACGKVGIVALVDEATGYQSQRAPDELQTLVAKYLLETPGEWKRLWDKDVVSKLCGLYGIEQRGESFPTFACNVIGKLYKLILPGEVYAEMRNRNGSGEERRGKLHQFFKEALWRFVHNDIPFVAYIARVSRTRQEFWNHMHARYGGQSFQLGMDLDGGAAE